MGGADVQADRRHDRQPLDDDEFSRLVDAAKVGPVVMGMIGEDRAVVYLLAGYTGLRRAELATLTPESFDLDNAVPTVTVPAGYTKNKKLATQPLQPFLVDLLGLWLEGKPAGERVFRLPEKTARMLRADLKAAGISYRDDAGRYRDFHSLRHRYGTALARAGVGVKVAMDLLRHSDVNLTMRTYTHTAVEERHAAACKLPAPKVETKQAVKWPWRRAPMMRWAHSRFDSAPETFHSTSWHVVA